MLSHLKLNIACEVVENIENIRFQFRKAVDADGDGEITKEEFVENAMKSRFMRKMLES